ncbi:DUF4181 domain-containing protein [Bacillus sp. AGMB 02131]|uniref:DUF4181 domain-containing protein n=1 Tax=Peribacillus faecalis TaxID=2772559 RepID=A0A927HBL6_9BACI|nr:DUF4181 domain-containing protein [Peribacillus faecalis]MBD3107528.1 DUF4181 domain-containing protein [Peribacillus faecalis]
MQFITLFIVFAILVLLIERAATKLLRVEKRKISETPAKRIDQWGRAIIVIIFLGTYWFVLDKDINVQKGFWIFYFTVLFGFQAFMEWKYLKNSKQYVVSLILLMLLVTFVYVLVFFLE